MTYPFRLFQSFPRGHNPVRFIVRKKQHSFTRIVLSQCRYLRNTHSLPSFLCFFDIWTISQAKGTE